MIDDRFKRSHRNPYRNQNAFLAQPMKDVILQKLLENSVLLHQQYELRCQLDGLDAGGKMRQ